MANAKIGAFGIVEDFAEVAPIPVAYNSEKNLWSNVGWMLPVQWAENPNSLKVKNHIEEIRPLLAKKYAPLQRETGNGNQGAYLSKISENLFQLVLSLSNTELQNLSFDQEAVSFESFDDRLDTYEKTKEDLSDTEGLQVSKSRRGQGLFKENVKRRMSECPVTGVRDPRFLVASHIKPWRVCTTAHDRLTGANGLLLARHVDHLFDKGFISFTDEGSSIRSAEIGSETLKRLGLISRLTSAKLIMDEEQRAFMDYHRRVVFKSEE
ncbi:MAG: HNH endonuclease signature motif containing protein [Litorimonas sp.]